jgi:serine protease Do
MGLVGGLGALLGFLGGGGGAVAVGPSRAPSITGAPPSFADVVERVNPAVVSIAVVEETGNAHEGFEDLPVVDSPRRGEGSGFVVDPDGYILTNQHLVSSPSRIRVRLADRRELAGRLVGADAHTDLALLKVEARGLPSVALGDSDRLRVGEWVCAIGNPYRFEHSVTVGVVSSKGRKIFDVSFDSYIQTDAAINPGNSGGPLINAAGEAIGISSAVTTQGQGIGFAVPINVARTILHQLRTRGRVSRGYLGVQLQEIDPDLQKLIGLETPRGAMVVDVVAGGAGERAGLKRYDVITAVSGQEVDDGGRLVHAISSRAPGSPVTLSVYRDGRPLSLLARLAERGPDAAASAPPREDADRAAERGDALGLVAKELDAKTRAELRVPDDRAGVVVEEVRGLSAGADALAAGDLVVEVNRRPTPDLPAYRRMVASLPPGDKAWLFVYRPRPPSVFLTKIEVEPR